MVHRQTKTSTLRNRSNWRALKRCAIWDKYEALESGDFIWHYFVINHNRHFLLDMFHPCYADCSQFSSFAVSSFNDTAHQDLSCHHLRWLNTVFNFRKFKVALNPMYRIFPNFAKSCVLSCLSKVYNIKKFHRAVLELYAPKEVILLIG